MSLIFPNNPTINQTSVQNGRVYIWTGSAWEFAGAGGLSATVTIPASGDQQWSNVLLMLKGDGSLADSSSYSRSITANGDIAATAAAKFGSASIALDGTGDYLSLSSSDFAWGTADYTLEAWVWLQSVGSYGAWFSNYVSDGSQFGISVGVTNTGYPFLMHPGGFNIIGASLLPTGQWVHAAVTRASNVVTYYINGSSVGTVSVSGSYAQQNVVIGRTYTDLNNNYWNGRIDDLRVTRGVARSITVPTEAYGTGAYTAAQTLPVVFS